jgi:hypothetical protein
MCLTRIVAVALALFALEAGGSPHLEVSAEEVIEGDPVRVRVVGLQPGQPVTVRASRRWMSYPSGSDLYVSAASFRADARGTVDLDSSTPVAGSDYDQADPSGLFWSMRKQKDSHIGRSVQADKLMLEGTVSIEADVAGRVVDRAEIKLRVAAKGVSISSVNAPGVVGLFARTATVAPQPAVIVLGLFPGR